LNKSWGKKENKAMAIKKIAPKQSKTLLAKEMGISRSSLYYKPKLPDKDLKLKTAIEQVMKKHKAYGHKRIASELGVNKKRVRRVMKLFNLSPKRKRRTPNKRKDKNQAKMAIPNLVSGIIIKVQNQVWASDFTYLPFLGRFLYLATIKDVYTRKIVGWAISFKHDTNLVAQALLNAIEKHSRPNIIHSDQGSEYRHKEYLNLLASLDIKPSMSEKASPWQNGYQESFFSEFKLELGHPECYENIGELIEAISGQIYYYNNNRIHTALKCSPAVFAQKINMGYNMPILQTFNFNISNNLNLTNQPRLLTEG